MLSSSPVKEKNLTRFAGDFCLNVKKVVRVGKLFSFYGSLLTDRQQEFVKLYYYHDLSLGEIANEKEISRQAVFDNLKRSEEALEEYEDELGMTEYYFAMQKKLEALTDKIDQISAKLNEKETAELEKLLIELKAHHEGELE